LKENIKNVKHLKHLYQFALNKVDVRLEITDLMLLGTMLDPALLKISAIEYTINHELQKRKISRENF
jgi:hypothetical protein